jgi:hypothetical protein
MIHNSEFIEKVVKFMYGKYYDEIINNQTIIINKGEIKVNSLEKEWNNGKYYCMISDILNNNNNVENMHGNNTNNHKYVCSIIMKYWKKDGKNFVLKFNWHDYMNFNEFIMTHNRRYNNNNQILFPYINYNCNNIIYFEENILFKDKKIK